MKKLQHLLTSFFGLAVFLGLESAIASESSNWQLNLTEGVTDISQRVYGMHMLVLWVTAAIGVVVFGLMTISIIKHRKSKGAQAATFHDSLPAEIIWTIIPFAILVALAIPATKALIVMDDDEGYEMTVKITGHQWKWEYEYPDSGLRFISSLGESSKKAATLDSGINPESVSNYLLDVDQPLVLPTNTKIRFLLTSGDVIHAWWVPDFAVKKDAIPGFVNTMWTEINEEGIYRGQCAELCGKDHGYMPIVVNAVSPEDYRVWVQAKLDEQNSVDVVSERSLPELMEIGEKTYGKFCSACHQPDGQGIPGVFAALAGSKITIDPAEIDTHIDVVLNGVSGTAMQAFSGQLNSLELAAVVTYERNAWGNDTGDVVQPGTVEALR